MSLWIGLAKRKILCSGYYGYLEIWIRSQLKIHKWQSNTTVLKRLNSLILISISTRMGAYCLGHMAKWLWNQTYHRCFFFSIQNIGIQNEAIFYSTKINLHLSLWDTKLLEIKERYNDFFFDHLSMHWNWWNNGIFRKLLELIALKERGRENWLMT